MAVAQNSTKVNAYLAGTGAMSAGVVTVEATGIAKADATVHKPIVSAGLANVAANAMAATLKASQKAYIETITLKAESVTVTSKLNENQSKGAYAVLGSNGGNGSASLSGAAAKANVAVATSNATNNAQVIGAVLDINNALRVEVSGKAYADALVNGDDFAAGAIGILSLIHI